MKLSFIRAKVRFLSPSQGGRNLMPIGNGYAPYIRATSLKEDLPIRVYGLPASGSFDEEYEVDLELSYHPRIDYSALKSGDQFSLIEGVKVIGSGFVLSGIFPKELQSGNQ